MTQVTIVTFDMDIHDPGRAMCQNNELLAKFDITKPELFLDMREQVNQQIRENVYPALDRAVRRGGETLGRRMTHLRLCASQKNAEFLNETVQMLQDFNLTYGRAMDLHSRIIPDVVIPAWSLRIR